MMVRCLRVTMFVVGHAYGCLLPDKKAGLNVGFISPRAKLPEIRYHHPV